jgi:hypothetical protein
MLVKTLLGMKIEISILLPVTLLNDCYQCIMISYNQTNFTRMTQKVLTEDEGEWHTTLDSDNK